MEFNSAASVVEEAKTHVQEFCEEAIEEGISWPQGDSAKEFRKERQCLAQAGPLLSHPVHV